MLRGHGKIAIRALKSVGHVVTGTDFVRDL